MKKRSPRANATLLAAMAFLPPLLQPSPARWTFTLERTIAAPFGSPGALAEPYDLGVTRDGRVLVLDRKVGGVLVYAADGRFERALGGRGGGPGEFGESATLNVRGDTVAVFNDGATIVWRADGTKIRQWRVDPCMCGGRPVLDGRGGVWTPIGVSVQGERREAMTRWTLNGAPGDTMLLPSLGGERAWLRAANGTAYRLPFTAMTVRVFDSHLRYIHGIGTRPELVIPAAASGPARVIQIPAAVVSIPKGYRDSMMGGMRKNPDMAKVLTDADAPRSQPHFLRLAADESDNIWIERPNGRGEIDHFDVMDVNGALIATAKTPAGQPLRYTPIVFRRQRMYWLTENEDGEPVVRVYRIERGR